MVRVNLTGTFNVTQKAAADSAQRRTDREFVLGQWPDGTVRPGKLFVEQSRDHRAHKSLRARVCAAKHTVNAIAPGFIDVGMSKGMPDEVTENFKKQIPLGRLGDAKEIVDAALFLSSPMASYITGHVFNVNGGFYMG